MLLKVKAKVMFSSEEELEEEQVGKADMGYIANIANNKEWVWAMVAYPVEEVIEIVQYSKSKSVILIYDRKILVGEPWDQVCDKYVIAKREYELLRNDKKEIEGEQKGVGDDDSKDEEEDTD